VWDPQALELELIVDDKIRPEIGIEKPWMRSRVSGWPASAEAWVSRSNSANIVCRTIVARMPSISRARIAARSRGVRALASSERARSCSLNVLATSATKIV
jgi:hypothetical protein